MKRILLRLFIGLLGTVLTCGSVWAQATAQISGTVRDQSGAVLPGVEVSATQTDTGISRSAVTNETGTYILPNVAVGPYRLEAALPGFRTFVQTGIVLQVNSSAVINPVLDVGQVSEQVEVQANVAQVETRSTAVGQVIENERILELPLNGRQVTDLVVLAGASVQLRNSDNKSWQGGVLISVAGGQSFGLSYSLDGAMHNNMIDGSQMPLPFPDALQEFKVEASGISTNGGMKSGGAVNAVTKSGTNEYHGDLFEFVRNYKFNARNVFAEKRDSLKRNQFGGTLGGPIIRNKLFFFGGYQGTATRSDPGTSINFVPTAAMLAGDFTTFASPACNAGRQITLRAPFANNRVDPALYSKAALNIAAKLPKAQDACGKVLYGLAQKLDEIQAVGKADYQWSANHSIFGRYMATTYRLPPAYNLSGGNLLTTTKSGYDNLAQSYALGDTYLLGSNTVNAFRLTVNRLAVRRAGGSYFSAEDVGVKGYSAEKDRMVLAVTGGFNLGGEGNATYRNTAYQTSDEVSLVRGSHQLAFGATVAHWRHNQNAHTRDSGNYSFTGTATGLGVADFLTGRLTSLGQGSATMYSTRQTYFVAFAADIWKVSPKLILSYGLRWEPFLPSYLTMGAVYAFDDDRFRKGIKSTVYPNAPAGLYYRGDPGFPNHAVNNRWNNFGPRFGLAWDVQGDGRTSIRASYGIAYDFAISNFLGGNSAGAPPWGFITSVESPAGGFEDPWRDVAGGNPFPYDAGPKSQARFTPFAQFVPMGRYDMATPTVQSWDLSVQRSFPADMVLSASYMGSQTTHLWAEMPINNATYFPAATCTIAGATYTPCSATGNTNQRRRLFLENSQDGQYYGALNVNNDGGTASYHGLLFSVQRRAVRGVNIGGNYTWSHCVGDATSLGGTGGGGLLDINNRAFDRGNCDSDRRHNLNLTVVAGTPQFANPTLRLLGSGWRVSGIYRQSSGGWLTIGTGLDRLLSGNSGNQRPNQILENPYGDRRSFNSYLNPSAFAQPAVGTMGNMGRANIEGPSTWQFDMALSRVFQFREAQQLEFRAEAFNVTNSLILPATFVSAPGFAAGGPTTNLNSNTFGQILNARDARIMQFALKYSF